jgi:cyclophilin family peptidyl-prolyl cis-trans isomerase
VRAFWTVRSRPAALRDEAAFKALRRDEKLAALERGQVFGRRLRNAPHVPEPRSAARAGGKMPVHTPPTGAELDGLALEAETVRARIKTKKGDIVFTFYPHDAKQHSAAFIKLARAGFYDGLTFHRVEPKFVIQGGCPQGTGTGDAGYKLDQEFNSLPHVKGTVAMARAASPNSAGSQFYICIDDARFLDKQYTVFGQTVEGQDVVDQIRVGDVMEKVTIEPAKPA